MAIKYRVKTEDEFAAEYGTDWRDTQDWNESLDKCLGKKLTKAENKEVLQIVEDDTTQYLGISRGLSELVFTDLTDASVDKHYPSMLTHAVRTFDA